MWFGTIHAQVVTGVSEWISADVENSDEALLLYVKIAASQLVPLFGHKMEQCATEWATEGPRHEGIPASSS